MKSQADRQETIRPANDACPFPDEVRHLSEINAQLAEAVRDADRSVRRLDDDYRDAKRYMVQNRSDIDPHEMFQSGLVLRQIDRSGAFAVEVRDRLERLRDSPYFARIDFAPDGGEALPYYIGRYAFTHASTLRIVDWRAPVAGMFYAHKTGPAHYDAPQGRIDGRTRKRQFQIRGGVMEYALESDDSLQDDVLRRELSQTSDDRMKTIIATIQQEQNEIIRNDRARTLIIQGVAGSGKTSIALHRVAFLLYRFRETLAAQNVAILSPNRVFADYIAGVLPELGEEPIYSVSLRDIADVQMEGLLDFTPDPGPLDTGDGAWAERVRYKSTLDFVREMDAFLAAMPGLAFAAQDYRCERFTATAAWIGSRVDAYARHPLLRRLAMIADDLHSRFEAENIREDTVPTARAILKSLKGMLTIKSTAALYRALYKHIGRPKLLVMPTKRTLEWNDVFPFLYLHAAYAGLQESRVTRHLVIDEMQDYTPVQLAVLSRVFPCDKTILGDFGQSIHPHHQHTLEDVRALYADAEFVELRTSYRSTWEIIRFARRLRPDFPIEAIARHGPEPALIACRDQADRVRTLRTRIRRFAAGGYQTLGIIVRTNEDAEALANALTDAATPADADIHLILPESRTFEGGVSIASVQMAKGLEFDAVIVPDADAPAYATPYGRGLLYVACTRAMHELTLLHGGDWVI